MAWVQRRRWAATGVMCVLVLAAAFTAATLTAQERFGVFLFAFDEKATPILDLTTKDVAVREEAGDAHTVSVDRFGWPLKLTVLLDNGPRTESMLVHYRSGLQKLFDGIPPGLPVSLISTAPQPRWLFRETTDRVQIKKGIGLITVDENLGRFADSLIEYSKRLDIEFRDVGPEKMQPYLPVLLVISTTHQDGSSVIKDDNIKMILSLRKHRVWTNFVMINPSKAARGGDDFSIDSDEGQVAELAKAVQENTNGRYFALGGSGTSGLSSKILPDLAKDISLRYIKQMMQYRVVFERPASATGPLKALAVSVTRPGVKYQLSNDGNMP